MRPTYLFLALMITGPAPGVSAQAVPRTDTPRAGALRFTFEPVITTWEREFTDSGHEQRIGAPLPAKVFVHEERRGTAVALAYGVTNSLAGGVRSGERRVGEEGRSRGAPGLLKKKKKNQT